jgi:hypothetical protein
MPATSRTPLNAPSDIAGEDQPELVIKGSSLF